MTLNVSDKGEQRYYVRGGRVEVVHRGFCCTPAALGQDPWGSLKGLSHEIFRPVFWPWWIYLGLNGNRFWFFNFKEGSLIWDSYFKYWCVSRQVLTTEFAVLQFSLFWVSGPPRNAVKGVNTSRIFVKSPRMIDILFRGSPRMFFNNISVSLIQLSILLWDSKNLREGLVWNASILKITV